MAIRQNTQDDIANGNLSSFFEPKSIGIIGSFREGYFGGYDQVPTGPVAIVAQTGMINPQAFPYLDLGCGASKICDLGNKSDVDECDVLAYLEGDPETYMGFPVYDEPETCVKALGLAYRYASVRKSRTR